jgi:hypothetical protein
MTVQQDKPVVVAVRVAPELAAWLKQNAAADHRSISAQVAWALSQFRKQHPEGVAAA